MALGVAIHDIARKLGHRTLDTTIGEYLHSFHFVHAEAMEELDGSRSEVRLSRAAVQTMLGITRRQLESLIGSEDSRGLRGIPLRTVNQFLSRALHLTLDVKPPSGANVRVGDRLPMPRG
jgi:hypothetical protein